MGRWVVRWLEKDRRKDGSKSGKVQKGGSWGRRGVAAEVSILYEMAKSGNGALANLAAPLHTSTIDKTLSPLFSQIISGIYSVVKPA